MKVLVCGSRDFTDIKIIQVVLMGVYRFHPDIHVIHGNARGADLAARQFAEAQRWRTTPYLADWKMYGKGAGPRRNQRMLDEGKPNLVLAFVSKPLAESIGTSDMVRRARAAAVPTYVIESPAAGWDQTPVALPPDRE